MSLQDMMIFRFLPRHKTKYHVQREVGDFGKTHRSVDDERTDEAKNTAAAIYEQYAQAGTKKCIARPAHCPAPPSAQSPRT
mmetsp:Transcript_6483/g.13792  ORF Transcript_6483/g.13792 Transcript_6483/m.13792 type:complete len:81 (+) Transcript_6483:237-479(+)